MISTLKDLASFIATCWLVSGMLALLTAPAWIAFALLLWWLR